MDKEKIIKSGTYKDIVFEVVFWTKKGFEKDPETFRGRFEGKIGTFNSYLYITPKQKELFEKFNIKRKNKYGLYDYHKLPIDMIGGVTFYEKKYDGRKVCTIAIGNDYNHIWNDSSDDFESVEIDIKETIDKLLN
jgi:hypothetical protein